jgi:hypothetical protein
MQDSTATNNPSPAQMTEEFAELNDKISAFNQGDMNDLFGIKDDGEYYYGASNSADPVLDPALRDPLPALPLDEATYNYQYPSPSFYNSPVPAQHHVQLQSYNTQPIQQFNQMMLPSGGPSYGPTPSLSLDTGEEIVYRNTILGKFSSPVTPLSIIDNHRYPFDKKLQAALEAQLRKEKSARMIASTGESRTRANNGKIAKNKRPDNIASFDPAEHYVLPGNPNEAWGFDEHGEALFQYTEHCELAPGRQYSTVELTMYLYQHPGHWYAPDDLKRSGLRLWIQNHPADSKHRYASPGKSDKCRWSECPVKDGTIHKGFFRVAFDEFTAWYPSAEDLDPFMCAGYVHLCCLEKMLDFPQLCRRLNVIPDCRIMPKEPVNRMAVNRDHKQLGLICNEFIRDSISEQQQPVDANSEDWYQNTLCCRLTQYHISRQPQHIQKIRTLRGGNNIDVHLGCCDVFAQGEATKPRRSKNDPPRPSGTGRKVGRPKRRRSADQQAEDEADEEFVPDANILNYSQRSPTKRSAKRPRRSSAAYQF